MSRTTRRALALSVVGVIGMALSCTENLPSGPDTFSASIRLVVPHDTTVVGDSSVAHAIVMDASGRVIEGLKFNWTSADPNVLGLATPASTDSDAASGRAQTFVGKRIGLSLVTLTLPDARFVTSNVTRNETVVVGGVRVLSSHDSTLTALNDTGFAIAAGLVRSNGALVTRASQGVRWTHLGLHATVVGQGDTVRYIAKSNGPDTLIATSDFCLAGAKCADTAIVRVTQQVTFSLSSHAFTSWSFADTVGPTVRLADRRGNGLPGSSVRFVPVSSGDSAIVSVIGPFGISNNGTGDLAAPKLVTTGNGIATVNVLGIGADGVSVVANDQVKVTVRQVARRVQVEPLRATMTLNDSIPIRPVARDARGAAIPDATITVDATGIAVHDVWAGPMPSLSAPGLGTLTPSLTGIATPESNPTAPQIPVAVDPALITMTKVDTVVAGVTQRTLTSLVFDSTAQPAVGQWVRFYSDFGFLPDSAQVDQSGQVSAIWTPPDSSGFYTFTGVRSSKRPMFSVADSAGRVVIRHSVFVKPADPSATTSALTASNTTVAVGGALTITVTVKDQFNNLIKTATPGMFAVTATSGTLGAFTCNFGVCTATYTAPAAAGTDTINALIGGQAILSSPMTITVQ